MELVKIKNLSFKYPVSEKKALNNINLSINQGEFVLLCGASGCGKSTLLRHIKPTLTPHGKRSGEVLFSGMPVTDLSEIEQASKIGYVLQDINAQIVTDKVWHELAFGLESIGVKSSQIRLRVAEMSGFFGIEGLLRRNVNDLSGGQRQLLSLAAVMTMNPELLILDEPVSQLDPIAAKEFLTTVKRINTELGVTVILSEHRLEEIYPESDRVIVMEDGSIIVNDTPECAARELKRLNSGMCEAMPTPIRVYFALDTDKNCPLNVKEGRTFLTETVGDCKYKSIGERKKQVAGDDVILKMKDVHFRYDKTSEDVIRGMSLSVKRGELYCICGGNGTGKSTALSLISRINKPYRGKIKINGKDIYSIKADEFYKGCVSALPQDASLLFVKGTIRDDLMTMTKNEDEVKNVAELMEITHILDCNPFDVSGGEQQRAAIAKLLLTEPEILLMDEPTKGMDAVFKSKFAVLLNKLKACGRTIILVSHDIEFCAENADTCALFFDGDAVVTGTPEQIFANNNFYTTAAARMSRGIFDDAITAEDVVELCRRNLG